MFNLEHEIAQWRGRLAVGSMPDETIDELESHLRDEVSRQLRDGQVGSQAFELAVAQLGEVRELQREFAAADDSLWGLVRRTFHRTNAGVAHSRWLNVLAWAGVVLGVVGLFFFGWGARSLYSAYMAHFPPPEVIFRMWITISFLLAYALVCALGAVTSVQYLRHRQVASARGLVGFVVFAGWLIFWTLSNAVLYRANPLYQFGSIQAFCYTGTTIAVGAIVWWLCVCRLARIPSAEARAR
jgi:hypothetical protein